MGEGGEALRAALRAARAAGWDKASAGEEGHLACNLGDGDLFLDLFLDLVL